MTAAPRLGSKRRHIRCHNEVTARVALCRMIVVIVGGVVMSGSAAQVQAQAQAQAQALTPDPGAWRPLAYANLQRPVPRDATYFDIWKDAIDANNRAYRTRGDRRFSHANAPASEAHFVIWSAKRSVVLSVLDTALGCSEKARIAGAVVKLCPMRIAVYDGLRVRTLDAGRGCFIELAFGGTLDPSRGADYGAYDVASRTLKIGAIVNHRAFDGCSFNIPLLRE